MTDHFVVVCKRACEIWVVCVIISHLLALCLNNTHVRYTLWRKILWFKQQTCKQEALWHRNHRVVESCGAGLRLAFFSSIFVAFWLIDQPLLILLYTPCFLFFNHKWRQLLRVKLGHYCATENTAMCNISRKAAVSSKRRTLSCWWKEGKKSSFSPEYLRVYPC